MSLSENAPQAAGSYTVTIAKDGTHKARLKTIDENQLPSAEAESGNYTEETIEWTLVISEAGAISSGNTKTFVIAFAGEDGGFATKDTGALSASVKVSIA